MADQNSSNTRPDLDESINVADAHASLKEEGNAVAREKIIRENGLEAIPIWLIILCGVFVLIGGSVLGKGGNFLAYKELTKSGYLRAEPPGGGEVILAPIPILEAYRKEGAKLYSKCAGCHQSNGQGGNGIPPLAGSEWVTGNTQQLSQIIIHGVKGPISVAGVAYNGNMPAMGDGLGKKELAALMTFIRTEWGNQSSLVTVEMAEEALKIAQKSGPGQKDVAELKKDHDKMLPGKLVPDDTLLDPETFEIFASETK